MARMLIFARTKSLFDCVDAFCVILESTFTNYIIYFLSCDQLGSGFTNLLELKYFFWGYTLMALWLMCGEGRGQR